MNKTRLEALRLLAPVIYVVAFLLSFQTHWVCKVLYALVALMWLVPDRRIERALTSRQE